MKEVFFVHLRPHIFSLNIKIFVLGFHSQECVKQPWIKSIKSSSLCFINTKI